MNIKVAAFTVSEKSSNMCLPADLDGQQADIPQISISEMKWSFLSGGAITCNSMSSIQRFKSRLDVHCYNDKKAFSGRYVVFSALIRDWRNILPYVFRRTWRLEIISAESMLIGPRHDETCLRDFLDMILFDKR